MIIPCERAIKEYLPAIRAVAAKKLHDEHYTQTRIAGAIGVTQAAVSGYLSGKSKPFVPQRLETTIQALGTDMATAILENKGQPIQLSKLCLNCEGRETGGQACKINHAHGNECGCHA